MSDKTKQIKTDLELAAEYEAKAKALRRREKEFKDTVIKRKEEVETWLDMSDKFGEICRIYNAETEEEKEALYEHIVSDQQINYYKRNTYKPVESAASSF